MKSEVESGEKGPDRNGADFRIKKAQVYPAMATVFIVDVWEDACVCRRYFP